MFLNLKTEIIKRFNTQSDFSQAAKINESKLSKIIRGRRAPSIAERNKISAVLGLPEQDLFQDRK